MSLGALAVSLHQGSHVPEQDWGGQGKEMGRQGLDSGALKISRGRGEIFLAHGDIIRLSPHLLGKYEALNPEVWLWDASRDQLASPPAGC